MRDSVDEIIIGQSASIKELKKLITVVAEAPTSVLIQMTNGSAAASLRNGIECQSSNCSLSSNALLS